MGCGITLLDWWDIGPEVMWSTACAHMMSETSNQESVKSQVILVLVLIGCYDGEEAWQLIS